MDRSALVREAPSRDSCAAFAARDAPDLEAAKFLARQSLEEMQHVDNFLRIMTMLGCQPKPAHAAVRFLSQAGARWTDVVKTTVFLADIADWPKMNGPYEEALGDHRPARSAFARIAALLFAGAVALLVGVMC